MARPIKPFIKRINDLIVADLFKLNETPFCVSQTIKNTMRRSIFLLVIYRYVYLLWSMFKFNPEGLNPNISKTINFMITENKKNYKNGTATADIE